MLQSITKRGVISAKFLASKMHNFCATVPIDLDFLLDLTHNKAFCWITFRGHIFWLGVGVTTKTVINEVLGACDPVKMSNFNYYLFLGSLY